MLYIDGSEDYKGVTIYRDDVDPLKFYLLQQFPRIRLDAEGRPAFLAVRYRTPINRPGGMKAGGIVQLDADLAVPDKLEAEIRAMLETRVRERGRLAPNQPVAVTLARPNFSKGTCKLEIMANADTLVQRFTFAAKPSLVGNNVISGAGELTETGIAVLEGVMKGKSAIGAVRAEYDLWFWAKLPPLTIRGDWTAQKFYSFFQEVDYEENCFSEDSYEENISEYLHNSESYSFVVNAGMGFDQKTIQPIQESMQRTMDEMVKRNMIEAIPAGDRDISKIRDQDIENVRRTFTTNRVADVHLSYSANQAAEINVAPNASLPPLGNITVQGRPLDLTQYFLEVDGDHPFFRTLKIAVQCNADFSTIPIFSVDVSIDYPPETAKHGVTTLSFRKPDDLGKFEAFLDNGGGKYKYNYVVNYKGEARTFEKGWKEATAQTLTINVDDLGVWLVDIQAGDLNFDQVDSAQLAVRYEDSANGVAPIERRFTLDKDHRTHSIAELIFAPREKPYQYQVKYFMKGGRELETGWKPAESRQLYVNDPFNAMRTVGIRSKGDFETRIDSIFLDLAYDDAEHGYRVTKSVVLSKAGKLFDEWTFPTFDERAGKLAYQGQIIYRDGTSAPIPETPVTGNTILVGEDVLKLEVELIADMIDWSTTKLAIVELSYDDTANNVSASKSFTLKRDTPSGAKWTVNIKDRAKRSYTVQEKFFMQDGSKKEPAAFTSDDAALVLEVPA